jgi:hypothetical protein
VGGWWENNTETKNKAVQGFNKSQINPIRAQVLGPLALESTSFCPLLVDKTSREGTP